MKKRGKRKYLNFSGIRVTGSGRLKGTLSLVRQVLEDNKRATNFVNFHRFTTRSAFGIRERKVFVFVRMGKFERMMAEFAKELLVTVFVVTVFVQAGGTAFWTREC
jgi:hypothetical protein